jgi:hypothetical protein
LPPFRELLPGVPIVESPLFAAMLDELQLSAEETRIALELHERGYAVMEFPDELLDERIDRIKGNLSPRFGLDGSDAESATNGGGNKRIQDAWLIDDDVRAIAANSRVLALLEKLYGRRPFPFQTLNFPVGTQQHLHSDSIHFSSIPERFMCGVWVAMEDVGPDAGPLTYLPGSHRWPILNNVMIGRRGFGASAASAQAPFEAAWNALIETSATKPEVFLARKGQALIWAANLLHGGSPQHDARLTRWSQVTHYYFDNCAYYTPAYSDEPLGRLDLRKITNVATGELKPNLFLGEELPFAGEAATESAPRRLWPWSRRKGLRSDPLPGDFDCETYLWLNPDVAAAGLDPAEHYQCHGAREGRRYRRG